MNNEQRQKNIDRSYLYGRLLAAYQAVEERARPNAIGLYSYSLTFGERFVEMPWHALDILDEWLGYCENLLTLEERAYFNALKMSIFIKLAEDQDNPAYDCPLHQSWQRGQRDQREEIAAHFKAVDSTDKSRPQPHDKYKKFEFNPPLWG